MIPAVLDIGTFVSGNQGAIIKLKDAAGEPYNLADATAITIEATSLSGELLSVDGVKINDPPDGEVFFDFDAVIPDVPITKMRPRITYEGVIEWQQGGEPFASDDRVTFTIELFP